MLFSCVLTAQDSKKMLLWLPWHIFAFSIFIDNCYCIIHEDTNIDLIPIYNNMSNNTILNLLNRSTKAGLSKNYLLI